MSRVLSRAGQFAHVGADEIDQTLSMLYRDKSRFDREGADTSAKAAVPNEIVRLYRSKAIPMMFQAKGTIEFVAERHGSLCALCHHVCTPWQSRGGNPLSFLLAPTYLSVSPCKDQWTGAICCMCFEGILRTYGTGVWWTDDRNMMLSATAMLLTKKSFRERVVQNRSRKIRFDPRQIAARS